MSRAVRALESDSGVGIEKRQTEELKSESKKSERYSGNQQSESTGNSDSATMVRITQSNSMRIRVKRYISIREHHGCSIKNSRVVKSRKSFTAATPQKNYIFSKMLLPAQWRFFCESDK